jgi:hypothetical protein
MMRKESVGSFVQSWRNGDEPTAMFPETAPFVTRRGSLGFHIHCYPIAAIDYRCADEKKVSS